MKMLTGLVAGVLVLAVAVGFALGTASAESKKADGRLYELRVYTAAPGKIDALNARFRDHTCKLFAKHGMSIVGFWVPTKTEDAGKLYYVLSYPDAAAAKKSWDGFRADPDWKAAKEASEKDGTLTAKVESIYMSPTDYSPMK